ncbi:MAG: amidoligase family protein [Candidatus Coprovivens sp.]
MSSNEKEKVDKILQNSFFRFRPTITMPKHINFGIELEMEGVTPQTVYHLVKNGLGGDWNVKVDQSLELLKNAEIVSPVLQNNKDTWILIKKMGKMLQKLNPDYNKSSFQVNFDGSLLPTLEDRLRFLKLYAMYEDIIYRFSKGEDEQFRESIETYASPIILSLKGVTKLEPEYAVEMFTNQKRYGVTFKTQNQDLIEFRTPNSTSNPALMQNYIVMFYYLLVYVMKNKYDKKRVDEYIDNYSKLYILESYERENADKAIEFAKEIYPHQIDRTFFYHQYFKK